MKTIKTNKRLKLNKHIVSEMNQKEMKSIMGGEITDNICDRVTKAYYCTYSLNTICL